MTTLQRILWDAAQSETRVRILMKNQYGTAWEYQGYVRKTLKEPDLNGHVVLHHRRNRWGSMDGWTHAVLSQIVKVTTSTRHRRTGEYKVLWEHNPFVLTPDGDLDMSNSLKVLLGMS